MRYKVQIQNGVGAVIDTYIPFTANGLGEGNSYAVRMVYLGWIPDSTERKSALSALQAECDKLNAANTITPEEAARLINDVLVKVADLNEKLDLMFDGRCTVHDLTT